MCARRVAYTRSLPRWSNPSQSSNYVQPSIVHHLELVNFSCQEVMSVVRSCRTSSDLGQVAKQCDSFGGRRFLAEMLRRGEPNARAHLVSWPSTHSSRNWYRYLFRSNSRSVRMVSGINRAHGTDFSWQDYIPALKTFKETSHIE